MSRSLSPRFLARLALPLLLPAGLIFQGASPPLLLPVSSGAPPLDGARTSPPPESPWKAPAPGAKTTLPSDASSPVALVDPRSRMSIGFRLAGARAAVASWLGGEARYEGALGEGTELRLTPRNDGVEDRVAFLNKPSAEHVDYLVDVRSVAGLRKLGDVVEFLDHGGAPRLRMEAPFIEGADGRVARARVEVGCAHDEDPRGPWGRPVVSAGVDECRVRVDWSGSSVTYPAVLDPVWTATGSLSDSRGNVAFGTLTSGRFLIAGGRTCLNGTCVILGSAELYDPDTETWAKIGDVSVPRDRFEAVSVPGKGLYLFGGDAGPVSTAAAEYYDEGTGLWKVLPSMATARANPVAKLLPDGKTIVVMGGVEVNTNKSLTSVEEFDTETEQWSGGGNIAQARFWATGNLLPDGKILLAGGTTCDNCGPMKPAEIYDPVSQTSEVLPEMKTARLGHGSALTTINGAPALLAFGGGTAAAEYFDFVQKNWISVGNMAENRAFFAHVLRPDGSIIVAGGGNIPFFNAIKNVERFDPKTLTWSKAAAMSIPRALMGYTQLPDGKILVAAGVSGSILSSGNTSDSAELFQPGPQGDTCQGGGDCLSGFCVDGVCCDKACGGLCEACSAAKKGSGEDGVCGPVAASTDPDDECPTQDKSTCGTSGTCDGQGACARYPAKTPCGAAQCVDGLSTGLLCSADGKCEQDVVTCAPFRCASKEACASSCTTDLECVPSAHCEGQDCKPDLGQGEACDRGAQCLSGFCVDGVCCASSCEGTCQACASSLKQDGGPDGVCAPALLDTDPHEDCATDPVASCDRNGSCDGKGACALHAAGTSCQEPTCAVDEKGVRIDQFSCDGSGTCQATSSASCGLFGCQQGACKTSCDSDTDCAPRAYCDEGQCVARKALGAICQEGRECLEGFCADGFCCNSACDGQCEACDVTKALGLCVPVSGAPHNERSACPAGPAGQPCQQRTCDGIERKSCEGFVGIAVTCKEPSCADGTANPGGLCDGKGACSEQEPVRCEPFACSGNACATSCKSDADCSEKFRCDVAKGDCVPRTGASCQDASTLVNSDGTTTDCAPYACEGSSCKTRCSSVKDCALPNVCDDATRTCVLAQPNPTDEAGCSTAPTRPGSPSPWLLLALALLRLRSRRGASSAQGSGPRRRCSPGGNIATSQSRAVPSSYTRQAKSVTWSKATSGRCHTPGS